MTETTTSIPGESDTSASTVDSQADSESSELLKPESSRQSRPDTSFGDRVLMIGIFCALTVFTGQWIWLTSQRPDSLPWQRGSEFPRLFRVDVNQAGWVEWIQLDGIGHTLAHRIVADRELNGSFRSIDDLRRVHGIGPTTLDEIRPWLTISHDNQLQSEQLPSSETHSQNQQPSAF